MKKQKFQSPTGMHDVLPEDQPYFEKIRESCSDVCGFYGFSKIDTPVLEEAELFSKGVGEATDIVKKELFGLKTKGGDTLALRPEGTVPIVRAYIEHGMQNRPQPLKLWYFGPFFRYERPQAERYRQFWQAGFEIIGENNPVRDAQIIQILYNIFQELKLKNLMVEVNSIGDSQCRPYYKKLLTNYFRSREASLCADCKRRSKENVLRILDCKEEKCQPVKAAAPQILDHLCDECRLHFKEVLEYLDEVEIPYNLNPYLVRGLDYYTKTVFEVFSENKAAQGFSRNSLGGGGRYDKLVKMMGGKDVPAIGAAIGIDRVLNLMKKDGINLPERKEPNIFLAQLGGLAKRKSLAILEDFRKARISVAESFGRDSLKAQLNRADNLGAKFALILGQHEALEGKIIIRNMETSRQETVRIENIVEEIKKRLKK